MNTLGQIVDDPQVAAMGLLEDVAIPGDDRAMPIRHARRRTGTVLGATPHRCRGRAALPVLGGDRRARAVPADVVAIDAHTHPQTEEFLAAMGARRRRWASTSARNARPCRSARWPTPTAPAT